MLKGIRGFLARDLAPKFRVLRLLIEHRIGENLEDSFMISYFFELYFD